MDETAAVLFTWIGLSILVGVLSRNRGRGFAAAFFVSLILSPLIGLAVTLGTMPNLRVLEKRALSTGELKKCPQCAELVKSEARVCHFCSLEFPAPQPPSEPTRG